MSLLCLGILLNVEILSEDVKGVKTIQIFLLNKTSDLCRSVTWVGLKNVGELAT